MHFASLQGKTAQKVLGDQEQRSISTVVLFLDGNTYQESSASIRAIASLGGMYKLFSVFLIVPLFIRNWIYRIIAKNRYRWFGKRAACRIPRPEEASRIFP